MSPFTHQVHSTTAPGVVVRSNKKEAAIWYEAFSKHDANLLASVLSDDWFEHPADPGHLAGHEYVKRLLTGLTTAFPDFNIVVKDMIEEGDKVVVRSQITGTQKENFAGIFSKNRKLDIQAIDIHQFKDGKIIRTWHSEDWMTGFRQLGAFEH